MPIYPKTRYGDEEYDDAVSEIRDAIRDLANMSAAGAWSTRTEEIIDKYGDDVIVLASFGDYWGMNGEVVLEGDIGNLREKGYRLTNEGGDVPTTEEEVSVEEVIHHASGVRRSTAPSRWDFICDVIEKEFGKEPDDYIYTSVSGETEVWAKQQSVEERPS
jgi:hypothetical protein